MPRGGDWTVDDLAGLPDDRLRWADRVKAPRRPADDLNVDDLLEAGTRCPHCRAAVRPGAPWCTLCHADLRPPPPAPEPVAPVAPQPPAFDPLTAPAAALGLAAPAPAPAPAPASGEPTWPCTTCSAPNPIAADACLACGAGFLSGLRETEGPLLELPGVGDLTRMSRGQRMLVAFGVVLAFVALTALLGLLFS